MAILDASLATPHFDPLDFAELITSHGTEVEVRLATRHGCWDEVTASPDPGCMVCIPFGYVWGAPIAMRAHGPVRKPTKRYEREGELDPGDVFVSFPAGIDLSHISRIRFPESLIVVDALLRKGDRDRLPHAVVNAVLSAHYTVRNPPTGAPYEIDQVDLTLTATPPAVPDLVVTGRDVTFNAAVPDGTTYVVQYKTPVEYVVWEQQERREGGLAMPTRYLCKRMDFLVKPADIANGFDYGA